MRRDRLFWKGISYKVTKGSKTLRFAGKQELETTFEPLGFFRRKPPYVIKQEARKETKSHGN
jgi:hypothetical protein